MMIKSRDLGIRLTHFHPYCLGDFRQVFLILLNVNYLIYILTVTPHKVMKLENILINKIIYSKCSYILSAQQYIPIIVSHNTTKYFFCFVVPFLTRSVSEEVSLVFLFKGK